MDNEKHARVVALRFADGLRVDIENNATHFEAIANMTTRAMRSTQPPILPLYEAATAIIPADRLARTDNAPNGKACDCLAGRCATAEGFELERGAYCQQPAAVGPAAAPQQPVPIAGIQAAMRAYGQRVIAGASPDIIASAERDLIDFFARYGVTIEPGDGTPEWLRESRRTPADVWKGQTQ
jgi:hypothetical protein